MANNVTDDDQHKQPRQAERVKTAPSNPLYRPQREKSGSVTADRFDFQYNWALFEFLKLHQQKRVSIVFVELHEDVVFCSSQQPNDARFIFCQVKAGDSAAYTAKSLVRRTNPDKPSVLGKMFAAVADKSIGTRVDKLRLVATAGFKLDFAEEGFSLEEIPWSAVASASAKHMRDALNLELGGEVDLEKLHFHKPQIGNQLHDLTVLGLIATLIGERAPHNSGGDSRAIYLALQDELRRKGKVTWDYSDWGQLIQHKGLTSQRVDALFEQFTNSKALTELLSDFEDQAKELQLSTRQRRVLRQAARTYVLDTLAGGSLAHIQAQAAICRHLGAATNHPLTPASLIDLVSNAPVDARSTLLDDVALTAAYIVEYLRA